MDQRSNRVDEMKSEASAGRKIYVRRAVKQMDCGREVRRGWGGTGLWVGTQVMSLSGKEVK